MTNESEMERRIEQTIEHRLEVKAGYSPTLSRIRHQSDAENLAIARSIDGEIAMRQNKEKGCRCYPMAWHRLMTPAEMAESIAELTHHRMHCPLWVDYHPAYPPSYTRRQERQDAEAESLER